MTTQPVAYPAVSSLYVGDLRPEVTDALLHQKFSAAGTVVSIRVCRDKVTRVSLGYAYVNFLNRADAETALENMNYDPILDKPCRIMWSQRDPAFRKSGVGNIFIKNLEKSIDNRTLFNTFSAFGNILSCKIAVDKNGSKGYGFIHFETEESARISIEKVNGMLLNGKKVFVGEFLHRTRRVELFGETVPTFNNVFVKNFADHLDDAKLQDLFSKFGSIVSSKVSCDAEGKSKGFGFVCFSEPESAQKAVEELHGLDLDGRVLYVGRAQKKFERHSILREKYEKLKQRRIVNNQRSNLYMKNLGDEVDEALLTNVFSNFGTVTSAKVMRENGFSKGFGFVCFSSPEEAFKAITGMQSKLLCGKPLYIAFAQKKEERAAMMVQNVRAQNINAHGPFINGRGNLQNNHYANQQAAWTNQGKGQQRGQQHPRGKHSKQGHSRQNNKTVPVASHVVNAPVASHVVNAPVASHVVNAPVAAAQVVQQMPAPAAAPQDILGMTSAMLFNSTPEQQREMIGNRIYPQVEELYPAIAGKITGMLLDIDQGELLHMLVNPDALKFKVEEAVAVLEAHQLQMEAQLQLEAQQLQSKEEA